MNLVAECEDLSGRIHQLRCLFVKQMEKIPDAPYIKRATPRCYIMSSNRFEDNWTPLYHDHPAQARAIIAWAEKTISLDSLVSGLDSMVMTGKLPGIPSISLHTDMRKTLARLLDENHIYLRDVKT
jgi:hypothetical protein